MFAKDALSLWGTYQGVGTKPTDFDKFWEDGKKEVNALGTAYELIQYPLYSNVVNAYEMRFTGVNQGTVYCQVVQPKRIEHKLPVILQFHGYHYSSGDWTDKISLAAEGAIVIAMDVRGQGGKSIDTNQTIGGTDIGHIVSGIDEGASNLFYRSIFLDTYQLAQIALAYPDVDQDRVHVYGVSQGGALGLVCSALEPKVSKAFLQYPFLSDYRGVYSLGVEGSAYQELSDWFKQKDPLHEREEMLFSQLEYIDIQHFADKVKAEVVWGMGLQDVLCPPKSQFAVYNKLNTQKQILFYPDLGHEYLAKYNDKIRESILK